MIPALIFFLIAFLLVFIRIAVSKGNESKLANGLIILLIPPITVFSATFCCPLYHRSGLEGLADFIFIYLYMVPPALLIFQVLLLLVLLIKNKNMRRSFLVVTPLIFIIVFAFSFRPLFHLSMHPEKLSVIKPESMVSLFDAVATGNHELLEKRLKAGANPNDRKEWRNRSVSPLEEAWRNCDYESFVLLHQHGALLSIMYLNPSKDIRFMKYALENGVDPNKFNPINSSDLPLYAYCNGYGGKNTFECIELLIRHGADVNLIPFGILQSHNIQSALDSLYSNRRDFAKDEFMKIENLLKSHGAKTYVELKREDPRIPLTVESSKDIDPYFIKAFEFFMTLPNAKSSIRFFTTYPGLPRSEPMLIIDSDKREQINIHSVTKEGKWSSGCNYVITVPRYWRLVLTKKGNPLPKSEFTYPAFAFSERRFSTQDFECYLEFKEMSSEYSLAISGFLKCPEELFQEKQPLYYNEGNSFSSNTLDADRQTKELSGYFEKNGIKGILRKRWAYYSTNPFAFYELSFNKRNFNYSPRHPWQGTYSGPETDGYILIIAPLNKNITSHHGMTFRHAYWNEKWSDRKDMNILIQYGDFVSDETAENILKLAETAKPEF